MPKKKVITNKPLSFAHRTLKFDNSDGRLVANNGYVEVNQFGDYINDPNVADTPVDFWKDETITFLGMISTVVNEYYPIYELQEDGFTSYVIASQTTIVPPAVPFTSGELTRDNLFDAITYEHYTYLYPSAISYDTGILKEDLENTGSLRSSITVTLTGPGLFSGTNGDSLALTNNVPTGLSSQMTRTNDTTATLSFTGKAEAHANKDDINNLTVTFRDKDFTGITASNVINPTKSDLSIDFTDPAPIPALSYSSSSFSEATANDGSITITSTITLTNDTFTGSDGDDLSARVPNAPAGLTAVLTRTNATTAKLSFTGNADAHANADDINDLTVTFVNSDFTGNNASAITNATKNDLSIDFIDPAPIPALSYSSSSFSEAGANDGSITATITITLTNDEFTWGKNEDLSSRVTNEPAGLTTVLTRASDTTASLSFTGTADAHANADDINNLTVTFVDSDFTENDASAVTNATKNDLSIDFADSAPNPTPDPVPNPTSDPAPTPDPVLVPTEKTVDGALIKETKNTVDGQNIVETILLPITDARLEDDSTAHTNHADISLGKIGNSTGITLSIPANIGFQANGIETTQSFESLTNNLITDIKAIFTTNQNHPVLGGENFLSRFDNQSQSFYEQKIKLTSDNNQLGDDPIIIDGTQDSSELVINAFVIDAKDLPAKSLLKLKQINFAAITGDVSIEAGDEANTLVIGETQTEQRVFGNGGDDLFYVGKGAHLLHGGLNTDLIQFEGNRSDYTIKQDFAKITITSIIDPNDVVTLVNAENLQFADETVKINYENNLELSAVAGTYLQVFGRQAHINGEKYWTEKLTTNELSLGKMALFFMTSDEQKQKIGFDITIVDTATQVEQFFKSLLGRSSNPEGKAFWEKHLTDGNLSLEDLATEIVSSPEMKSHYASTLEWDFVI